MASAEVDDGSTIRIESADEVQSRRYLIFVVVSTALFMASIDQTIVATALGTLQRDLHTEVNWSTWTITVYALGQILVLPLAGSLSQQFGRKRVFVVAIMVFTVASLCCGLANDIYVLILLRAVQAIGGGAFMPSATGIVADQFGPNRDRAIGLFSSIFPIGGIVGPVLGGVFVTYWSWRWIFFVNVPIGGALLVLAFAFIPGSRRRAYHALDVVGIVELGIGLLSLMVAMSYLGSAGSSPLSPIFILLVGMGAASVVAFVRHCGRVEHPFVPLRLLRGRGFAVMNLINFLYGAAAVGLGTLVPLYAQNRYDLRTLPSGTLLTARALGMIASSAIAVLALRRTGYRLPMMLGYGVTAVGLVAMSVAPPSGISPYLWLAISAAVTGAGLGTATPASNNAVLQLEPDGASAIAGLRGMFKQVGGITSISVVAAILSRSGDPGLTQAHVFVVLAAILVGLIPMVLLVPEHRGTW